MRKKGEGLFPQKRARAEEIKVENLDEWEIGKRD